MERQDGVMILLVLGCISCLCCVQARSTGAPSQACGTITPGHSGTSSQPIPGGYYIYSDLIDNGGGYDPSTAYTIRLEGDQVFKGFLIQARTSGTNSPIGAFSNLPSGTQHRTCSSVTQASVTHTNTNSKSSVVFTWTSPSNTGTVQFQYAVVQSFTTYFANINADAYRPPSTSSSSSTVAPTTTTTTSTISTTSTTSTPSSSSSSSTSSTSSTSANTSTSSTSATPTSTPPADCPGTNKDSDSTFPIVFRRPDGCEREDCTLYWAMGPNNEDSTYLDVYMEGTVGGWMALGFSQDKSMINSDVLGCRIVSGSVQVIDTWNNANRNNEADTSQDGVCVHMMEYTDGKRLKCMFSRSSAITDINQDYNLEDPLYIFRGYRNSSFSASALSYHDETPTISDSKYYLFSSTCPNTDKTASSYFPLTFAEPTGCVRDINCSLYWAMGPNSENSNFLDIYLEGDVSGWLAVGFSKNTIMRATDVLSCRVNSDDTVSVSDGWNPDSFSRSSPADDNQDGVCVHMAMRENGRLSCLFSRYSVNFDTEKDLNLDDLLYVLRGYRNSSNFNAPLMYHTETPSATSQTYNPLQDSNSAAPPPSGQCPTAPSSNAVYPVSFGQVGQDYFFASRVNDENSNYLDITLQGRADGWVAVGFSATKTMLEADVFGCKRESNSDTINVIDTWNRADTRINVLDSSQTGICQHSAEYVDGVISCTFSRLITISDDGEDLNLNSSLFQMYSATSSSRGGSSSGLGKHSRTPSLSGERLSLASDALTGRVLTAVDWPKKPLIQTHGVFMILSWILLASTGIFFASWMKPILPNGEWFQVHRAIMIASLFTGVIGFILAFVAHAKNTEVAGIINFQTPDKEVKIAHFAFGWIIILFHIANPLIAVFRCAPNKPRRWIFNLIHGHLVGLLVEIIAIINVGMGIYLIEKSQGNYTDIRVLIPYLIFVVITLILQLFLFIFYTINALKAPEEHRAKLCPSVLKCFIGSPKKSDESVKMSDIDKGKFEEKEKPEQSEKPAKKKPLEDAPVMLSWISVIIYMVTVVATVLALIILIAIL